MHTAVFKIAGSMSGVMIPSLLAGVIYLIIAVATGAPTVASITGGIVVAALAVAIGLIVRTVYERRTAASHR
jgi:phosphate/sulfate permease